MRTIQDILASMQGVWLGTYTVLNADGTVADRFDSRQEGLLEGNDWTEKVVYYRPGEEPKVSYFHAEVHGNEVDFTNEDMWGETGLASDQGILFRFGWLARPEEEIMEVSTPRDNDRTRIWRHLENNELTKVTVISERRDPSQQPERWRK